MFTETSLLIAPFAASSTFKRIGVPEVGDQTFTVIFWSVAVKGIAEAKPAGVEIVVPAQVCAPVGLIILITVLAALVGSAIIIEALDPKSVIV